MTITGAAPVHYDENFACCGGCSSSKRADAYNGKFATGSLVFIWDIKLKTSPQPVCSLTFPYDPALNEQVGERRVRSGRLVGTSYPIDNDYDHLCCEQRGACLAQNEDASGKCQCVNRWGYTGDHCEYSLYDVAEDANAAVFPNSTNLSYVDHVLPDLRQYLLSFDYDSAISSAVTSTSPSEFLDVLEAGSYRQYAWSTTAYFILAAVWFAMIFMLHVMWTFCLFKCGCRRRNPLAKPKIYSKLQKIVWGTLMMLFLFLSTAAAVMTLLVVNNDIKPLAASALGLLNETIPNNLTTFEENFLLPLDELLAKGFVGDTSESLALSAIQDRALTELEDHTFLDKQSYANDVIGKPVFDLLDPLASYSLLYPTVNNNSIDCEEMNITQPSVVSRMTIGARTGCFKCKTCLTIVDLISEAKTTWRKHIFEVQIDMLTAKRQLRDFNQVQSTLTPAIQRFLDRMHKMCEDFRDANDRLSTEYDALATELRQFSLFGLFGLLGLCGLSILLGASAFARGLMTGKRKLGRVTCFFSEIALLVALVLTGVLYTMSVVTQDAIIILQRLDENAYVFLPSAQSAEDVNRLLFDQNFVEATRMTRILEFSDTLRVPPHPTAATDDPERFNFSESYDMSALFALEDLTTDAEKALTEMFAWNEDFASTKLQQLRELALTDSSVATPYTGVLHHDLLNSTILQLMDPDSDGDLVTAKDFSEIKIVFNTSWRGLDDEGVSNNEAIQSQWLFVARLYYQKQRLKKYVATVSSFITKIHPVLDNLIEKTAAMEDAEFQLKAPVEFVTDSIRASKIADCNYNGNCAWFRAALNELFDLFQQMVHKAERATISCFVSSVALFLAVLCTNAFTSRMRRNVVKVYTSG